MLLAHPWTHLPFGEVATRTNLFSAACAAGASAALAWAVSRSSGGWVAPLVAGLAVAIAPLQWSQAVVTEVHALSSLFAALLLALAVTSRTRDVRNRRPPLELCVAVGFLWGLSLGNSPTAVFCLPVVVIVLQSCRKGALAGAGGLAVGLSVYALLPIRAPAAPPVNWGDPRTLDRFWWVVSGALYRGYIFRLPLSELPQRLLAGVQLVASQFGVAGLAVVSVGVASSWSGRRHLLAATGATSALILAFAIGYDTTDSYLYLLPLVIYMGYWLGAGVAWMTSTARARLRAPEWAVGLGLFAVVVLAIVIRMPGLDLTGDRTGDEFRSAVLDPAPPRAVIVSQRDSHTFALWYYQHATGRRPDVVVIDLGLLGLAWYNDRAAEQLGDSAVAELLGVLHADGLASAARTLRRPVCLIAEGGPVLVCQER